MASPIELVLQTLPAKRLRKPRKQREPRGIERSYNASIQETVDIAGKLVDELLISRLPELARAAGVRSDQARIDLENWPKVLAGIFADIRRRHKAATERIAEQAAGDVATETSTFNRTEVRRQMRGVLGVDIFFNEPELLNTMEAFTTANVGKIKTISDQFFGEIEDIVSSGFRSGQRAAVSAEKIQERFGVSKARAQFIAVDQIGSLNGQLTRQRQTALGVEQYIWRTSRDERVRETHRQLEGSVQSWDDPPTVGERNVHPGEDYRCRCTAEPVIEGVEAIKTTPADVKRRPKKARKLPAAERVAPVPTEAGARTVRRARTGQDVWLSAAQALRKDVAATLQKSPATRRAATTDQRLDYSMWNWVHGSHRKASVAMKQAAIKEFGLKGSAYNPKGHQVLGSDVRRAAKDLRVLHGRTQAELKKRGVATVKVYRGTKVGVDQRGALESWTTSAKTARKFAGPKGYVRSQDIPIEKILTMKGGPGWLDGVFGDQAEVVVLF